MSDRHDGDRGTVLVLTLIFTVVLAVIALALAQYAAVGTGTSSTTDLRSETNADAAATVTWAMEAFRVGDLTTDNCLVATDITPTTPTNVNGSSVTLTCFSTAPTGYYPIVQLEAVAVKEGVTRRVQAVVQFAAFGGDAVRAIDWSVDDVPLGP